MERVLRGLAGGGQRTTERFVRRLGTITGEAWLCLWPGLAALWREGSWRGLATAVAFSGLVNGLLAVTLVWYELTTATVKWMGWSAAFGTWFVLGIAAYRNLPKRQAAGQAEEQGGTAETLDDHYSAAVNEYLKRSFVEAERLARQLIKANAKDVPAGLLLAGIYRRGGRMDEAKQELARLASLEAAEPWQLEIERELEALNEDRTEESDGSQAKAHAA